MTTVTTVSIGLNCGDQKLETFKDMVTMHTLQGEFCGLVGLMLWTSFVHKRLTKRLWERMLPTIVYNKSGLNNNDTHRFSVTICSYSETVLLIAKILMHQHNRKNYS